MKEKIQGSCSANDSNVFDEGLDYSDFRNILYNCLKKLETRVTEIFDVANSINENRIKDARKLEDLTDVADFIRKKFEDCKAERRQMDEVIKSLRGQVSALHNNLKSLELKLDNQEQ